MRGPARKVSSVLVIGLLGSLISLQTARAEKSAGLSTPTLSVSVDPRVELISIIFRLAGNPEYSQGRVEDYIRHIEKHFGPHRNHAVVELARRLRQNQGVGYDAPMGLAVRLTDVPELKERVSFDVNREGLDERWQTEDAREFLEKARDFVVEAKFEEFVKKNQSLYDQTALRASDLIAREGHLEWFDRFFGARPGAEFRVVIGLVNGGCCYGAGIRIGNREELYCILGAWKSDYMGVPKFDKSMIGAIVHEFCHAYVNPIVYANASKLEAAGNRIFPAVRKQMNRMAYGNWTTMMHESVVRASVVRYLADTTSLREAGKEVERQIGMGFFWMDELSRQLGQYEQNREEYPTLETFFPRIVEFFDKYDIQAALTDSTVPGSDKEMPKGSGRKPQVVEMIPANGATNVTPAP